MSKSFQASRDTIRSATFFGGGIAADHQTKDTTLLACGTFRGKLQPQAIPEYSQLPLVGTQRIVAPQKSDGV